MVVPFVVYFLLHCQITASCVWGSFHIGMTLYGKVNININTRLISYFKHVLLEFLIKSDLITLRCFGSVNERCTPDPMTYYKWYYNQSHHSGLQIHFFNTQSSMFLSSKNHFKTLHTALLNHIHIHISWALCFVKYQWICTNIQTINLYNLSSLINLNI